MILATALLAAAAVSAQAPATPPPETAAAPVEPAKQTLQQRFDQAQNLALAGNCTEAIPQFEALEASNAAKAGSLSAAVITVLKGRCLIRMGKDAEGEMAVRQGLPRLRKEGTDFNSDVASGLLALGDVALRRWDYAGARAAYEQALAVPDCTHAAVVNLKLAQAAAFDGGEAPLRYIDAAIRSADATPDMTKEKLAEYRALRARILLNQGRNAEAYTQLKEVLKMSGGLDLKVRLADIVMRGDLALAARLAGDEENARKYLAYTGAGRIKESPFTRALSMNPPVCGTETGLRPENFAVVDFAIGPDGHVVGANTVYTPGSAEVAAQFARAVSQWVWDPADLAKIPPFFLMASRVEVRCTKSGQEVPGLTSPLKKRFAEWATAQLGSTDQADDDSALATQLASLAAQPETANDAVRQAAVQGLLAITQPNSDLQLDALFQKALLAAASPSVPIDARNALKILQLDNRRSYRSNKGLPAASPRDLLALLETPDVAADILASDTIRLLAATPRFRETAPGNSPELLGQVASDARLPEHHPLRQAAYLRLANIAAEKKDFAKAQDYFKATGLTEEQCALLGVTPAMRRSGASSNDFPMEAYQYGFEGWVSVEFDIQSDGRTVQPRPLIAYPPFLFAKAATGVVADTRFETSFRPSGGSACSAQQKTVSFMLPN